MGGKVWSPYELEIMEKHYSDTPKLELLKMLGDRTWHAILNQGRRMGLSGARINTGQFQRGHIRSVESRRKQAETISGENNVSKRPDVREKISKALDGKPKSEEHKRKMSITRKGKHFNSACEFKPGHIPSPKAIRNNMERLRRLNKDPAFQRKRLAGLRKVKEKIIRNTLKKLHERPTEPESKMIKIVKQRSLPFKYVGDGEVLIGGLNPDFVSTNGERKVLEVFGRVFHDPDKSFFKVPWKNQYFGRMAYYRQNGYDCLIIWDDELDDEEIVASKINEFLG